MLSLESLQVVDVTSLSEPECNRELEGRLEAILRGSQYFALTQLTVQCDMERVLLRGDLETYFLKQAAQELVRPWLFNRILSNECKVGD